MTDNPLEQNPEQSRTLSVNDDHQIHDETRPPGSEDCPLVPYAQPQQGRTTTKNQRRPCKEAK